MQINKNKIRTWCMAAMAAVSLASCTKDFKEINTDPNRSSSATPEALLQPALYAIQGGNLRSALRLTNELMQDHVTVSDGDEIHRYIIRPSESDFMWNLWYQQRTNFVDMYERATVLQQKYWQGVALICDVWVTSQITDMFGDVPYAEANNAKGGNYQPKFDKQKAIYDSMFHKLERANTFMAANGAIVAEQIPLDPVYGARLDLSNTTTAVANFNSQWRKFGNSLYLRLLMRVSGRADADTIAGGISPVAKIKEIAETKKSTYPVFTSNTESAIVKYTTTAPYATPFNTYREFDFNGDNGLSQFFIDNLKTWNDPRITRWASTSAGVYEGIPSGYAKGNVPPRKSAYLASLMNEPLLGNIMNYAELQFILAEAALKGYITGDPKPYYENGIINAIAMWGVTMPTDYLQNDEVKWDNSLLTSIKMNRIFEQKYYTLFFTDFQQWTEYRRTGYPILPKGPGLANNGVMPARFKYPVAVQSLNKTNYDAAVAGLGGPDDINTKVWWNQ